MIKVVSWNIGKRKKPWRQLVQMAREGDADLALLQEAGSPPGDLVHWIEYMDKVFWNRQLYDRWPLVVKLSDRITVEPYRQVPPTNELGEDTIGVSGIGTIAASRVIPCDNEGRGFCGSVDVRTLVASSSVYQEQLGCRLLGCLSPSDHFGPVRVHRSFRPYEAQDPGCG